MQLFRGEEFPPRMIRAFTRLTGIAFAQKVVGPLIDELMDKDVNIKLDTRFDDETSEVVDLDAMLTLCVVCLSVLFCPHHLSCLCCLLNFGEFCGEFRAWAIAESKPAWIQSKMSRVGVSDLLKQF